MVEAVGTLTLKKSPKASNKVVLVRFGTCAGDHLYTFGLLRARRGVGRLVKHIIPQYSPYRTGGMDQVESSVPAFPEQVPGTPGRKKVLAAWLWFRNGLVLFHWSLGRLIPFVHLQLWKK